MDDILAVVNLLETSNIFRKDLGKLYADTQMIVHDEFSRVKELQIERENWWSYESMQANELVLQYHFRASNKIFGISFICAINPEWIKTMELYRRICNDLQINNIKYPLIAVYGIFDPRENYYAKDWFMLYMGINNWPNCTLPEGYVFDKDIIINSNIPKEDWLFNDCKIKIKPLLEITTQQDILTIVKDLFNLVA